MDLPLSVDLDLLVDLVRDVERSLEMLRFRDTDFVSSVSLSFSSFSSGWCKTSPVFSVLTASSATVLNSGFSFVLSTIFSCSTNSLAISAMTLSNGSLQLLDLDFLLLDLLLDLDFLLDRDRRRDRLPLFRDLDLFLERERLLDLDLFLERERFLERDVFLDRERLLDRDLLLDLDLDLDFSSSSSITRAKYPPMNI